MDPRSGRIGVEAMVTLIAMVVLVTALSTLFSIAVVAVGRASAVFVVP